MTDKSWMKPGNSKRTLKLGEGEASSRLITRIIIMRAQLIKTVYSILKHGKQHFVGRATPSWTKLRIFYMVWKSLNLEPMHSRHSWSVGSRASGVSYRPFQGSARWKLCCVTITSCSLPSSHPFSRELMMEFSRGSVVCDDGISSISYWTMCLCILEF